MVALNDKFSLLGRVGVAHVKFDTSNGDGSGTGPERGQGAQYASMPNVALRGEWKRYQRQAFDPKPAIDRYSTAVKASFQASRISGSEIKPESPVCPHPKHLSPLSQFPRFPAAIGFARPNPNSAFNARLQSKDGARGMLGVTFSRTPPARPAPQPAPVRSARP